jgi:putative PIN family toxin of toxin-antitoxin system
MPSSPTVVLDTNVLEAAFRSRRGASFAVVSLVGTGRFEIAVSVPLVLEYEDVLMRQAGEDERTEAVVRNVLDYLCSAGKQQEIYFQWRPTLPDPDDDMVLELAVAAGCDAIVTHNRRDFRGVHRFGLRLYSPAEFLRRLGV